MGDRRFHDFDAAWAERAERDQPPGIRVFGEDITLPASEPAKVYLLKTRVAGGGGERALTTPLAIDILRCYVGDVIDRWVDERHLEVEQLVELLFRIAALYKEPAEEDEPEGEAPAPGTGAPSPT